jgi:hypothetical protein
MKQSPQHLARMDLLTSSQSIQTTMVPLKSSWELRGRKLMLSILLEMFNMPTSLLALVVAWEMLLFVCFFN